MSKKSHHFLMLWPWPLTYDLEKLIRSGHYHYQCVYQIWEQSIQWFLSYRVNTIAGGGRRAAGGGRRAAGGGRLRRKTITSPDPSDTGDIITVLHTDILFNMPLPTVSMKISTSSFMSKLAISVISSCSRRSFHPALLVNFESSQNMFFFCFVFCENAFQSDSIT